MIYELNNSGIKETAEFADKTVKTVATGKNCGWPVYDRLLHNPVEDAVRVEGEIVLLEGNYLLLKTEGWKELKQYADLTVSLTAEPAEADLQLKVEGDGQFSLCE